jgi:hypothetical protein
VTRYLLKNYKYAHTKPNKVGMSTQYLLKFNEYTEKRISPDRDNWKTWTIDDLETILIQAACYTLSLVANKMMNKPEGASSLDVWNKLAGSDVKRAALFHSYSFMFSLFRQQIQKDSSVNNK